MNEKKFLQQMYGKLENQLEQEVKLADDSIEISEGDKAIFKIDSKGDVLYSADKQFSNIVNKLHGKIENDVRNTKEFLKVMDNSPELTAVDLNAPYKKLLEYNDVVLDLPRSVFVRMLCRMHQCFCGNATDIDTCPSVHLFRTLHYGNVQLPFCQLGSQRLSAFAESDDNGIILFHTSISLIGSILFLHCQTVRQWHRQEWPYP